MMNINIQTLSKVIAIAVSLALAPAHAASDRDASKSNRAEKRAVEKEAPKKADERNPTSDTESCRRDAQGMHGPARANFMTECLRKRP